MRTKKLEKLEQELCEIQKLPFENQPGKLHKWGQQNNVNLPHTPENTRQKQVIHMTQSAHSFLQTKMMLNACNSARRSCFWAAVAAVCASITIVVAAIFYFVEAGERKKAKHYQAWQVINLAQGKESSGGRVDALQDLVSDNVLLTGIDLSYAFLKGVDLSNGQLEEAIFNETKLHDAILQNTNLQNARFQHAQLQGADFSGANCTLARFIARTNLTNAILQDAIFNNAFLTKAVLKDANFEGADFFEADLSGANLENVKGWKKMKRITLANIYNVRNPPEGFIEWAKVNGAVSIENILKWHEVRVEWHHKKASEKN